MCYIKSLLLVFLTLVLSATSFAKPMKPFDAHLVPLYAKPSQESTVVTKVNATQSLVLIYRQNDWIKVGDPANGKVGWLNKKQYHEDIMNLYRPEFKTIYMQATSNPKSKTHYNIVAYKNGKKISDQEAEKMYKTFQDRQTKMFKKMQNWQSHMNKMFKEFLNEFDDDWLVNEFNDQ